MRPSVRIDCFDTRLVDYPPDTMLVLVDVIRSSTTAQTAVATGHRCVPVASIQDAFIAGAALPGSLLAGEVGGVMPAGFDLNNSPAAIAAVAEAWRPIVLLSSSGTRLMCAARPYTAYIGSLRTIAAQASYLAHIGANVAVIGAATRGQFRLEDRLCCAWLAEHLMAAGFQAPTATRNLARRWSGVSVQALRTSDSARYLERSGQQADLEFVLSHVDDLSSVYQMQRGEIVDLTASAITGAA